MRRALLTRFIRDYPFQPATAVWRAIEIGYVLDHPLPQGRGMDLGCGDGLLTRIVAERTHWDDIVGVDPDPEETRMAVASGVYAAVHTASAADVPEPDGSFDWIFSNSVLEHVDEIEPILAESARLLKPGGDFVVTVPGPGFHRALRGSLFPWVGRRAYLSTLDKRLAHRRYWGDTEWRSHLEPLGFEIIEISEYMSRSAVRRWETVARWTSGILFSLFGRRRHPIEIQRTLAMRRGGRRLPRPIAALVARFLGAGVRDRGGPYGCVYVHARRLPVR